MKEKNKRLIEIAKQIVTPDFQGVYSSDYLRKVIFNMYDEKSKFCLVFGDFNGLNDINIKYGRIQGDIRLKNSLEIIKSQLPQKAVIARIAGDEFIILINEATKEDVTKYINNIYEKLKENEKLNKAITIEMAAVDSSEHLGIYEMLEEAEKEVEQAKIKKKSLNQGTKDGWKRLEKMVIEQIDKFLKNLRIERNDVPNVDFRYIRKYAKKSKGLLTEMLEKGIEEKGQTNERKHQIENFNKISKEDAVEIYDILREREEIPEIEEEQINKIIDILSKDTVTNTFTKEYFEKLLLPFLQQKNQTQQNHILYFETSGLKMSNTLIGHEATDEKLVKIVQDVKQIIIEEIGDDIQFANKLFTDIGDNESIMVNIRGGKILVLLNDKINLTHSTMERIRMRIDDILREDVLKVFSEYKENVLITDILPEVKKLETEISNKNNTYKTKRLEDKNTNEVLKVYAAECIDAYSEFIPNAQSKKNKKRFTKMYIKVLFDRIREVLENNPSKIEEYSKVYISEH